MLFVAGWSSWSSVWAAGLPGGGSAGRVAVATTTRAGPAQAAGHSGFATSARIVALGGQLGTCLRLCVWPAALVCAAAFCYTWLLPLLKAP